MVDGGDQARAFGMAARPGIYIRGLKLGEAFEHLKAGARIAREGWDGQGMWLSLSAGTPNLPAANFWSPHNRAFAEANGGAATVLPSVSMKTATGEILMGWTPSGLDLFAEDWCVVFDQVQPSALHGVFPREEPRVPRRDERLPGSRPHP